MPPEPSSGDRQRALEAWLYNVQDLPYEQPGTTSGIIFQRSRLDHVISLYPISVHLNSASMPVNMHHNSSVIDAARSVQTPEGCGWMFPAASNQREFLENSELECSGVQHQTFRSGSPNPDLPLGSSAACPQGLSMTEPSCVNVSSTQGQERNATSGYAAQGGKRRWSEEEKRKHSEACKDKSRLTLAEKLQIIDLFQNPKASERKSQKELAVMFNKSRMTISTLLRPASIAWYKQLADGGVRGAAKRCKRSEHPDLERLVFEAIGKGTARISKAVNKPAPLS